MVRILEKAFIQDRMILRCFPSAKNSFFYHLHLIYPPKRRFPTHCCLAGRIPAWSTYSWRPGPKLVQKWKSWHEAVLDVLKAEHWTSRRKAILICLIKAFRAHHCNGISSTPGNTWLPTFTWFLEHQSAMRLVVFASASKPPPESLVAFSNCRDNIQKQAEQICNPAI